MVLNINELFQAVRPPLLPGDIISIRIVRKGNQEGQGIGTWEDGSMIVVEKSQEFIGKKVKIEIRQVLGNPSGTLVFAELANS